MLKKFIVTMALVGVTAASYGQGTVNFETANIGAGARIMQPDKTTPAFGNGWFAQLYAAAGSAAAETALAKVGNPVNLRGASATSTVAGYVQTFGATSKGVDVDPVVVVTPTAGGPATVQLRAWNSGFDTYELAEAAGKLPGAAATTQWGKSAPITIAATGGGGSPPGLPADLTGLGLTQLQGAIVPEPTTIALGALGAAALLFARRRK